MGLSLAVRVSTTKSKVVACHTHSIFADRDSIVVRRMKIKNSAMSSALAT